MCIQHHELSGIWDTNKDNIKVEIYKKDGTCFGEIVSSDNAKAKIGTVILKDFILNNGIWEGKFYSVYRDKLVNALMQLDKNILKITVLLGQTSELLEWKKD
jgi:hypothetical protein